MHIGPISFIISHDLGINMTDDVDVVIIGPALDKKMICFLKMQISPEDVINATITSKVGRLGPMIVDCYSSAEDRVREQGTVNRS